MVLDVALDNGDSRFIKHLLALSMRRPRQQGTRGGQEMENNARCLGKAYGCSLRLLTRTSRSTAGTFLLGRPILWAWLLIIRFELFSHLAFYRPQSFHGLNFSLSSFFCTYDCQAIWRESPQDKAALCTENDTSRGLHLVPSLYDQLLPTGYNRRKIKYLAHGS